MVIHLAFGAKCGWSVPVLIMCGDYKVTANQAANTETYSLPCIEEVLATLIGGRLCSILIDLTSAYQQVLLDEYSKKCITINMRKSLYVYKCLAFGISSAPSISSGSWKI